jgi:hypothetical protein
VVSAIGRAVLFLPFLDDFRPAGRKSSRKNEVKYLAAAGNSGIVGATA